LPIMPPTARMGCFVVDAYWRNWFAVPVRRIT
jgi:hypothetical protein